MVSLWTWEAVAADCLQILLFNMHLLKRTLILQLHDYISSLQISS